LRRRDESLQFYPDCKNAVKANLLNDIFKKDASVYENWKVIKQAVSYIPR
jgi:hypothetical protein